MVEYRQKNLDELVFDGQDLTGSIFDRCNLFHCSFKNCIMNNVTIDRCNCIECNWEGVNKDVINFICSNIIDKEPEEQRQIRELIKSRRKQIENTSEQEPTEDVTESETIEESTEKPEK